MALRIQLQALFDWMIIIIRVRSCDQFMAMAQQVWRVLL